MAIVRTECCFKNIILNNPYLMVANSKVNFGEIMSTIVVCLFTHDMKHNNFVLA
jgi:hypothetical protein